MFAIVILIAIGAADAMFFPLTATHEPQCFKTLNVLNGNSISGSFEISGSNEEVFVTLQHPNTDLAVWSSRLLADHFQYTAASPGQYQLCFKQMTGHSKQTASFQIHISTGGYDDFEHLSQKLASKTQAEKVGILTAQIENKLQDLMDQQDFSITREAIHRDTTESTNTRVLWWSLVQVFVLVTLALIQMYYIKSYFEIKLIV